MTETNGSITANKEIAEGIFDMKVKAPEAASCAKPGQFVSLYSTDQSRLLPRPISICNANDQTLRLVYRVAGAGTKEFSEKRAGETIRLVGPLGNGFPEAAGFAGKRVFLFGGGIGIPPMLYAAGVYAAAGAGVTAVLGYRDQNTFLANEFSPFGEVLLATEDGSVGTKGNVLDAYREAKGEADVMMACGPLPMLRALQQFSRENGIPCFLSLEEKMACAVGACLGCVVKTVKEDAHSHVKNARVCKDGPVFLAEEIVF
ncbi:MAG: dihydroorotate dehydrogenase electron transfer subunit [Lachnospiraceae bacterium]|nr:dihydroorotate dehydrogenase electron transfer subunit [Lachnospiraceae bacterium]